MNQANIGTEHKPSKSRLFIENFLVYGLGGVISKIVPLIMLPIVTRLFLSTECFGISVLSNTAVNFGSVVAVLGMYDAMYRMFFEKDEEDFKELFIVNPAEGSSEKSLIIRKYMHDDCIMIGDTEADYNAANIVGIKSYILNRGFRSQNYWNNKGISSYPDLTKFVEFVRKEDKE